MKKPKPERTIRLVLRRLGDKALIKAYLNGEPSYPIAWLQYQAEREPNPYKLVTKLRLWGYGKPSRRNMR